MSGPLQQGELDGLCGVYAIINAVGITIRKRDFNREARQDLFRRLCDCLLDGRRLGDVIIDGISCRDIGRLIDVASQYTVQEYDIVLRRKIAGTGKTTKEKFLTSLRDCVAMANSTAILSIAGEIAHWSVVKKVSEARINLHDSDGLRHLSIRDCSVNQKTRYIIQPTQSYLITLQESKVQ